MKSFWPVSIRAISLWFAHHTSLPYITLDFTIASNTIFLTGVLMFLFHIIWLLTLLRAALPACTLLSTSNFHLPSAENTIPRQQYLETHSSSDCPYLALATSLPSL